MLKLTNLLVINLLFMGLISHTSSAQTNQSSNLRITELRCEQRSEPLNVDTDKPRFSWILESDQRGAGQSAFELMAATSADLLASERADLWKSGKQTSGESHLIEFAGSPLKSNQQVFWTVRVWDENGHPTPWSKPSRFWTAILDKSDWKAQWIGSGAGTNGTSVALEMAKWIWSSETTTTERGLPAVPANEVRWLDHAFDLATTSEIASATLTIAADNEGRAYINGTFLGQTKEWEQALQLDVLKHLKPGQNHLAALVKNGGDKPNAAAVAALLSISYKDGSTTNIVTNDSWQVSPAFKSAYWRKPETIPEGHGSGKPGWHSARVVRNWGEGPWQASGVQTDVGPRPIFRKEFNSPKKVVRAVAHVCGLGHHKFFVNGKSVSDNFLEPAWAQYPKTCFYSSYDITPLVKQGPNAFGVMLANGFYNTAGDRRINGNRVQRPLTLLVQAHVEYEDGTVDVVTTDGSWKWRNGPWLHTSILGGVDYDARELADGWASAGLDDKEWTPAQLMKPEHGELVAAIAPPLREFEVLKPISVTEPEKGHYVYDFGQNASAAPRIRVKGKAGSRIRLDYAEQRHGATPGSNDGKGRINQSGVRSPNYVEYILRGDPAGEQWFPDLFYSGYNYMELTGGVPAGFPNPQGLPVLEELVSVHVRSSAETVGTFRCSDPMYEKIDRMVEWSVRSNLAHVLTDCPHREKMGWLEVIHLMWPSIASRYDLADFGAKVAKDVRDSQYPDGKIPTVAPAYPTFDGGFQYTPEWGAAGVFIPWYTYQWYGDKRVLESNYDCMRAFVEFMHRTSKDLVPIAGLGDWYDYGHGEPLGPSRFTPTELSAMATFGDCSRVLTSAAKVLGRSDDAAKYEKLAQDIRESFNKHWRVRAGEYKNNGSPQTANAMAVVTKQVPESETSAAIQTIIADMRKRDWQQTAGDVGFHYLVRALADNGGSDAIFKMLARTELGSYQFLANANWTALPESWNAESAYSMNHCMLGHIQEWFAQDLGGIKPNPESVAFKKFYLAPVIDGPITSAGVTQKTPYGKIECSWSRTGDTVTVKAHIPVNSEAHLRPSVPLLDLTPSTDLIKNADGTYRLVSGSYQLSGRIGEM